MWKPVLAASAAILMAGSSFAYAQHRSGHDGAGSEQKKQWPESELAARNVQNINVDRLMSSLGAATPQRLTPVEVMQFRASPEGGIAPKGTDEGERRR